jgi:hypothetical protein
MPSASARKPHGRTKSGLHVLLAMQKVVGSSPISRSREALQIAGFSCSGTSLQQPSSANRLPFASKPRPKNRAAFARTCRFAGRENRRPSASVSEALRSSASPERHSSFKGASGRVAARAGDDAHLPAFESLSPQLLTSASSSVILTPNERSIATSSALRKSLARPGTRA